jgi:hypothetical protein
MVNVEVDFEEITRVVVVPNEIVLRVPEAQK